MTPFRDLFHRATTFTGCAVLLMVGAAWGEDWRSVGNDAGGMRYSPLTQINRENVKNLQVAWVYRTGELDPAKKTTIECTPIVVDGVMFVTTIYAKAVALDAATGRELWKFDPYAPYASPSEWARAHGDVPIASGGVNRGVAYWSDGKSARVLLGTADGRLFSLDARTGKPDPHFGKNGVVDLRAGLEWDCSKFPYGPTSAPAIYENLVILGFSCSEGPPPGAPGDVRAFDVRSGKEVWRFRTVPRPGEFGYDTWPPGAWKGRSGVNAWGGLTVDTQRGIVFCGTGSAAADFYGGDRKGANLFANCVLALDARTGKRRWHFQTTHHDLWDHDNPCPPVLVTVKHQGKVREAVAQVTKTGFCYVLDRLTGKPLFGVKEVPAPPSDVPGEQAYPTQPQPLKPPPFARQIFEPTDISPQAQEFVREQLRALRYDGPYTPPSLKGTVVLPGFHGGATWSGASFDPTTGILYVNANNVPWLARLVKKGDTYDFAGYYRFTDSEGYPAVKPPWGSLTAINLNTGEIEWQVVLGEYPELTARGVPPTGTENFGGTIVTAGGLVFIGGTMDEKFRAFDKATGTLLWEYQLPAGGYATPCTYAVNGRQFVVIAAGGGGKLQTKPGDSFIAFALPSAGDRRIRDLLEPIRQKYKLPALAGAIVTSKGLAALGAVGVRKAGTDVAVTVDDQWHIGSDTKAMTATLIAALVEQGKLRWDTTIEEAFPDLAPALPSSLTKMTLLHLLAHRTGLPANLPLGWHSVPRLIPIREQRQAVVKRGLKAKLESEPGAQFGYSNLGYVIAGAMAEKYADASWEDLMNRMIFQPLDMKSTGFGGVGTPGEIDQPWGHTADGQPVSGNGPDVDNPPVLGPAGRVHCTLSDWAKFIADQLRGARGAKALLKPESYRKLHTPPFGGDYALGWLVTERDWGGGKVLTHAGSNTMNFAVVWMAPQRDFAVLVVTNQGGDAAARACDEAAAALIGLHLRER
ncbi:MAG: serine hydrolase [Abditibacteriales bacterium]|nr:serine hydrolase [Abditibacteriales bacterium]MDW8364482.1 serine hydrolase [Abditibacteriales bacterium]